MPIRVKQTKAKHQDTGNRAAPLVRGQSESWDRLYATSALAITDEQSALELLPAIFDAFVTEGDDAGTLLTAATAVTTYHAAWSSFAGLSPWLLRLAEWQDAQSQIVLPAHHARIDCAMLVAPHLTDRAFKDKSDKKNRLSRLHDVIIQHADEFEVNELFLTGRALYEFIEIEHWLDAFEPTVLALRNHAQSAALAPKPLGRALVHEGRCYLRFNLQSRNKRYADRAEACWQRAHELGAAHALNTLIFAAAQSRLFGATTRGEVERYGDLIEAMEHAADVDRPMQLGEYFVERTKLALAEEHADIALSASAQALGAYARADVSRSQRGPAVVARIAALGLANRFDDAAQLAEEHMQLQAGRPRDIFLCLAKLLRALALRSQEGVNDVTYVTPLREGISQAALLKWPNFLVSLPKLAARLCADALVHDIEMPFVTATIAQRKLMPPDRDVQGWPWPVEVSVLGTFHLRLYGKEVDLTGRVQKKPLELLKCLAAAGAEGVESETLAAALWPEADGAQARSSLKVTVLRVRKMLEQDAAIEMREGHVALAETYAITDVERFDRLSSEIDTLLDRRDKGDHARQLAEYAQRLPACYAGPLLGDEPANSWLLRIRNRLHGRYLRLASEVARVLLEAGRGNDARHFLERATEQDPIAEHLHRQLMSLYLEQGEQAEAMRVYRRLRQSLSVILGIPPSERTLALVKDLRIG